MVDARLLHQSMHLLAPHQRGQAGSGAAEHTNDPRYAADAHQGVGHAVPRRMCISEGAQRGAAARSEAAHCGAAAGPGPVRRCGRARPVWRRGQAGSGAPRGLGWCDGLHDYAGALYSHPTMTATEGILEAATGFVVRADRGTEGADGERRIRVGIVGATGYVGAELIRLLVAPPERRARRARRAATATTTRSPDIHPHLRDDRPDGRDAGSRAADAVFLALPHGVAAGLVADLVAAGTAVIDLGPDFRLRDPADYPRWYGFEHPRPDLLEQRRLRPAGAASRRARGPRGRAGRDRRRRPAATRPPRSWRSPRSPGPGSSATSSSTPRAACPAPAASRSRTSCSARSTRASRPTASAAIATSPRSSRSWPRRPAARARPGRQPGRRRHRLPAPPDPDDPRHPLGLPRPADAGR